MLRFVQTAANAVRLKSGVWSASAGGFIVGGIGLIASGQTAIGRLVVGFGLAMLAWGITIYGRNLWEPWWRGPIRPDVNAFLFDFPYEPGTTISGMQWENDFSHVNVRIANCSDEMMLNLNFIISLDRHIIKSAYRAAFAKCSIGPASVGIPTITVLGRDKDGKEVAIRGDKANMIDLAPRHRFICAELPPGAEVEIDLATVVPLRPPSPKLWTKGPPSWINIAGSYGVRGAPQYVGWHMGLAAARSESAHRAA